MGDYIYLILLVFIAVVVVIVGLKIKSAQKKRGAEEYTASLKAKKLAARRAELTKSIKKVSWDPKFSVDEGIIDQDHQFLFNLINKFNENIPKYQTPSQLVPALTLITKYTQNHFAREIKLQKAAGFLHIEEHHQQHNDLIAKYNGLVQKATKANEDTVTDVAVEIGAFLEEWLVKHVLENDLAMKPYVDKMRDTAGKMDQIAI